MGLFFSLKANHGNIVLLCLKLCNEVIRAMSQEISILETNENTYALVSSKYTVE
jgi:hypothetical protein